MGTSGGDNQIFPIVLIGQSIRGWFPSDCLRLCRLCLKGGWVVTYSVFLPHCSPTEVNCSHVTQLHKPGCDRLLYYLFKSLPQFQQLRHWIFSDYHSFLCYIIGVLFVCFCDKEKHFILRKIKKGSSSKFIIYYLTWEVTFHKLIWHVGNYVLFKNNYVSLNTISIKVYFQGPRII